MNIDYKLLEKQRDHLLAVLWHDDKDPLLKKNFSVELDSEIGWGIINLLDALLDKHYNETQHE